MKNNFKIFCLISLLATLSCKSNHADHDLFITDAVSGQELEIPAKPLRERVLTAAEQAALTPGQVLDSLKSGNRRFVDNDLTLRNHTEMVRKAALGQYPKAVILSCIDSRVPVEDVFDKGIGDMFVVRIAGNFANPDILGSLEYGCKVSGAKLILVLGHQSCGAIKAAIGNYKLGNITEMLSKIKPAIKMSDTFNGNKTGDDASFVELVSKNNIVNTIKEIRKNSPLLNKMEQNGQLKIVGGYYNINTGEVVFL
ncbi:carbonic anhydrase [Mucilaginibacter sp. ZT4R22]|uniref:Carbonic anhydrase n=1 Tax=Mucilaginibacter pankratovii TaxID=2772110 RepID=A0ABR7WJZ1_9SPHI|nr:carbonic anhydrase family protein [Mucilaginibacter pankratovii]MBD1362638.1 carbonic anhydrase [Mucilaginibacter pankratovii]